MFWKCQLKAVQGNVHCAREWEGGWRWERPATPDNTGSTTWWRPIHTTHPPHLPPTSPHHPRSQPQLRIRGKSIFSWIAISSMERNSKDYFLFCKTRNCFSLSLTKVLWETSNATRSDLFLLRRILVWHFTGGWIVFKLKSLSFQQKQTESLYFHGEAVMWRWNLSIWANLPSRRNGRFSDQSDAKHVKYDEFFCSKIFHCNCVTAGFPYFNQLSLCWLRSNHFCEDM